MLVLRAASAQGASTSPRSPHGNIDQASCPAKLLVDALRVEFISDWALLEVVATLDRHCTPVDGDPTLADAHQVSLWPSDVAVLSLSIRAGEAWTEASWRESGNAYDQFHAARAGAAGSRGRAMLLEGGGDGGSRLLVRPLARGQSVKVKYQVVLPAHYEHGTQVLDVSLPEQANAPLWQVVGAPPGEAVPTRTVEGGRLRFGWRSACRGLSAELAILPPPSGSDSPWTGLGGDAGAQKGLGREPAEYVWHLRSEGEPLAIPARAHLVVAIDSSRSLRPEAFQAQLRVAEAWLKSHLGPKVALLTYDREVHPATQGFVTLEQALDALRNLPRDLRNGSYQDLALAEAGRLLRPVKGDGRVLLLGDGHVRAALTALGVRAALPAARRPVLVGLVASTAHDSLGIEELLGDFPGTVSRIDPESPVARLPELLTPQSIDDIELVPEPVHASIPLRPINLAAGESLPEPHRHGSGAVTRAGRLSYRIWGTPYVRWVTPTAQLSRLEAAWRSRSGCADGNVQRLAQSVTPLSSLLVVVPGRLDSAEAEDSRLATWTCGGTCEDCEAGDIPNHGVAAAPRVSNPAPEWLDAEWQRIRAVCGVPRASVVLETDGIEIADVALSPSGDKTTAVQQTCLRDAAWSLTLQTAHSDGHGFWLLGSAPP